MRGPRPGLAQGFLRLMAFEHICSQAQPLHEVAGGGNCANCRHVELEVNRNGVHEQRVCLLVRVVHTPSSSQVFPAVEVVAEIPDVLTSAEGHELILPIFFDLLFSSTVVFVVSAPELKSISEFCCSLSRLVHTVVDVFADKSVQTFSDI